MKEQIRRVEMKKPDVLSDRALLVAYENAISPSKQWKVDLDRVRRKAVAQAQRDADVAYYEPIIRGLKVDIESYSHAAEVLGNNIQQAKAEVARMKALSIKQPWAWLICAGHKDVENRNWWIHMPPLLNYPATPRRIYVHASKTFDVEGYEKLTLQSYDPDSPIGKAIEAITPIKFFFRGAIIGEVDIVGCKYRYGDENNNLYSPWHEVGMYGLLLANPILYDKPIPCKGKLGFFEPSIPSKE